MHDHASFARLGARLLIGPLAALCLVVPVLAGPGERPNEKSAAAKVAKKMQKALATSNQAEEEREALRHFQEEVADYADLHARQLAKLGTRESVATQEALARAIEAIRVKARPGDIFQPEVQPLFRRLIAEQPNGPDALDARKAVIEGNPGLEEESVPITVRVNAVYPLDAPRSTLPLRGPLQAAPRRRSPCRPRQPRQPERAFLRAIQHGRRALPHLPGVRRRAGKADRRWRALLRTRHRLPGQAPARLAGAFALEFRLKSAFFHHPFTRPAIPTAPRSKPGRS